MSTKINLIPTSKFPYCLNREGSIIVKSAFRAAGQPAIVHEDKERELSRTVKLIAHEGVPGRTTRELSRVRDMYWGIIGIKTETWKPFPTDKVESRLMEAYECVYEVRRHIRKHNLKAREARLYKQSSAFGMFEKYVDDLLTFCDRIEGAEGTLLYVDDIVSEKTNGWDPLCQKEIAKQAAIAHQFCKWYLIDF